MSDVRLVLDVGNTETAVAVVDAETLEVGRHWRFSSAVPRTGDEFQLLLTELMALGDVSPTAVSGAVLGSVVPVVGEGLRRALEVLFPGRVQQVRGPEGLPIRLDVEEPRTVGVDRIVNTLAAAHRFGRDTIAVDFGTATTYDCITADGVFKGGVIAPGIVAGEDWLASRTAKLPRVDFRPPEQAVGRRTETCLHSGLFYSVVDGVDGIVRRIKAEFGDDPLVVATGGRASLVAPYSSTVDQLEPFLTLQGLALAGRALSA
jgi:type III pantothenate kinase